MFHSPYYPDVKPSVHRYDVEHVVIDTEGITSITNDVVVGSSLVGFNPSFVCVSPDSFSISNQKKSGSPLNPSPKISFMDMHLNDEVTKVFNDKIAKI